MPRRESWQLSLKDDCIRHLHREEIKTTKWGGDMDVL
jgi:hypothetical protein